jgi:hypothetical protein
MRRKIHAKSFRFLYANYSKALQAGTLVAKARGKKSFKIYASKDSTNKEVGIKNTKRRMPSGCFETTTKKSREIFWSKNL